MIIPSAYLLYRFLKRFPIIIVAVIITHSCLITTIEYELELEEEVELYTEAIQTNHETHQLEAYSLKNKNIKLKPTPNELKHLSFDNQFCKTAYYDLFILYLNISIDRQVV